MTLDRDTIVVRLGLMNDLLSDLETIGGVDAATAFRPDGTPSPGLEREDLRTRAWTWPLSFKFAYWTSWRACGDSGHGKLPVDGHEVARWRS